MTSLSALIEAAKVVEYDKVVPEKRRRNNNSSSKSKKEVLESDKGKNSGSGTNNRETHNILEKNRRAELKNFFQKLKEAVPKLQDRPKAPNVSILTEAMKYIQDLNAIDKQSTNEVTRLRRCRMCLEERIKMLKEEINRQSLQKQLFAQVEVEKKTSSPAPAKEMVSIEIQANEQDILDALPECYNVEAKLRIQSQNSCETEVKGKNKRPEQLKLSTNERTVKHEPSPCSPLNTPVSDPCFLLKQLPSPPLSVSSSAESISNLKKNNIVQKRSRYMSCPEVEESDSESELKIVLEDIS